MARLRRSGVLALVAVIVVPLVAGAAVRPPVPASAPNPSAGAPIADLLSNACASNPDAATCEDEVVVMLDRAREAIGLRAYALPSDFATLAPDAQLLTLVNLDRAAYSETPMVGAAAPLDAWTTAAAKATSKPPAPLKTLDGHRIIGQSIVALSGSFPNVLVAYFVWMYDDGPGGPNAACTRAGEKACWSHRQTLLVDSGVTPLTFGVGVVPGQKTGSLSVTALIVATASTDQVQFTTRWLHLVDLGAGANHYAIPPLPELPPTPHKVKVVRAASGDEVTLFWSESRSPEPLSRFLVVYEAAGTDQTTYAEIEPSSNSYHAENLDPGTEYAFAVSAIDADGNSLPLSIYATTPEVAPTTTSATAPS